MASLALVGRPGLPMSQGILDFAPRMSDDGQEILSENLNGPELIALPEPKSRM